MLLAGGRELLGGERDECRLEGSTTVAGGGASVTMGSGLALRRELEGPVRSGPRTSMIGMEPGILKRGGGRVGAIGGDSGSPNRVG